MTYSPGPGRQLPQDPFGPAAPGAPDQPPTAQQVLSGTPPPPARRPGGTMGGWLLIGFGVLAAVALPILGVAVAIAGYSTSKSNHPIATPTGQPTPATTTGTPADTGSSAHTVGLPSPAPGGPRATRFAPQGGASCIAERSSLNLWSPGSAVGWSARSGAVILRHRPARQLWRPHAAQRERAIRASCVPT